METTPAASSHPYESLSPELVLDAVESLSLIPSGHLLALNSYENRVYQVGLNEGDAVIVKFYRPGRWSNEAILEEHAFASELAKAEIPVIAPICAENGQTLHEFCGFRFALFPRRGGRAPELDNKDHLMWLGRFLGRMHAIGGLKRFQHRPQLGIDYLGYQPIPTCGNPAW